MTVFIKFDAVYQIVLVIINNSEYLYVRKYEKRNEKIIVFLH